MLKNSFHHTVEHHTKKDELLVGSSPLLLREGASFNNLGGNDEVLTSGVSCSSTGKRVARVGST